MNRFQRNLKGLDQLVHQHMQAANVPGMAIAMTDRKGLLHQSTYGFANLEARLHISTSTLFEIGSLGKSFTAIAVLQQHEAGRLDIHAPVTQYLPWFRIRSRYNPITVHHLLTHAAGIPRGTDVAPASRYEVAALHHFETAFAPGEHFVYSNTGYKLLGFLLEEIAGRSYGEVIQTHILDPLGMTKTDSVITHETRKRLAVGYQSFYDDRPAHSSHPLVPAPWLEYGAGDGSLASTPSDMAAYLRMLLNRGHGGRERILSEGSFRLMTKQAIKAFDEAFYGYGLFSRKEDGHTIIAHGGGMVGYQSMMLGDIDAGLGVIVLINGPGDSVAIAEFALRLLQAVVNKQKPPELETVDNTKVQDAAIYAGVYKAGEKTLTLTAQGDTLALHYAGETILLEIRGPNRFYLNHPDLSRFLLVFERAGNDVTGVSYGPDWYVSDRYSGPTGFDYPEEWEAYPGHYRSHNPWLSNFRVVLRKGALWIAYPSGIESPLAPLGDKLFRVGEEEYSPERVSFDMIINSQALRANLSGCQYYRALTP